MALKDIIDRIDTKFEKLFHEKPFDPVAARKPLLAKIEATKTQFTSAEPVKGRGKWYKVGENSTVAFSPTLPTGHPLLIDGKSTTFWPSAEFPMVLDLLVKAVNKGDVDDQLTREGTPGDSVEIKTPRKRAASTGDRAGWTPERRERFAQSVAARKAAKEAAAGKGA